MQTIISNRHRPLDIVNEYLITYHAGGIYAFNMETSKSREICRLPLSLWDRIFCWSRLYERLMRTEIRASISIDNGCLLYVYKKRVYCLNVLTGENKEEFCIRGGVGSPYYFCDIKSVDGFEDCVVFGEYNRNNNRRDYVRIYKRSVKDGKWSCAFEFRQQMVRHIHGIVSSPQSSCVYILTGDDDSESGIWKATNNFTKVEPLVIGSQLYRAVRLFVDNDKLIYATDTPNKNNYIFIMENTSEKPVVKEKISINGSCIYASDSNEFYFFSSTVEPDEHIRGLRSWINYKLGKGIKSRDVYLYCLEKKNWSLKTVEIYRKDIWPYKVFQYGYCDTRYYEKGKKLIIFPVGVKKYDGKLMIGNFE